MFGFAKKTAPGEAAPPVALVAARVGELPGADYIARATEAGLGTSATVILARIRLVLSARGLYVYDLPTVEAYLDREFGGHRYADGVDGAQWCWIPITAADRTDALRGTLGRRWNRNGYIQEFGAYGGAIPLAVVETIHALRATVPDLKFFISGQATMPPVGDPFLAVWHASLPDVLVIERWDEPGFR